MIETDNIENQTRILEFPENNEIFSIGETLLLWTGSVKKSRWQNVELPNTIFTQINQSIQDEWMITIGKQYVDKLDISKVVR